MEYCRHIGVEKPPGRPFYWVARVRRKDGGYKQIRLTVAKKDGRWLTDYGEAIEQAKAWFETEEIKAVASASYPVGVTQELRYTNSVNAFTVGDALLDYVEWKRIAATRSHFETNLSLINYHLIPRLGDLPTTELTSRVVIKFCRDVIETPPKRGNQKPRPKCSMDELSSEALRKRKKTVNALLGILRLALRMAWENGEIDSERSWRCIHSLPNFDAPRNVFLSRAQCRKLITSCRSDLAALVKAALYSGCRVSELARMEVGDVGAGVFGIYVRPSKNGRARYVILSSEGMSFFLDVTKSRPRGELLFKMDSGKSWAGGHKHLFKAAVRKAGLPDEFVFHGLRHTYASQLVQAGTPLAVVAKQLGHATTDTVSRTYGHLCCDSIEKHIEQGFATLDQGAETDSQKLKEFRATLELGELPMMPVPHWPKSNFALASFVGPRN